jgi:hypothetical protein
MHFGLYGYLGNILQIELLGFVFSNKKYIKILKTLKLKICLI